VDQQQEPAFVSLKPDDPIRFYSDICLIVRWLIGAMATSSAS
jgi:hypothetical protein